MPDHARTPSLEEWQSGIRSQLTTAAADEVDRRWIEGLRTKARIRVHALTD